MSVAALEAMAAGLPLIVTRTGGTNDLVEEGANGFVIDRAVVETLSNHLRTLSQDRERARKVGACSSVRSSKFTWDSVSRSYLDLLFKYDQQQSELI
jgi:glycosyltransferase involved in cell wall biosynthesis